MAGSFMPAPFVSTQRPRTPVVPASRIRSAVEDAERQAERLAAALAKIEAARHVVARKMAELSAEKAEVRKLLTQVNRMPEVPSGQYRIMDILQIVSVVSGVSLLDLTADRRTAWPVQARQTYFWLARRFTGRSLPEIGRRCGGKDHTTVLHGQRKVERLLARFTPPSEDTPAAWARVILEKPWGYTA